MNQKKKLILLIAALAAVLIGAFVAYRHFSTEVAPQQAGSAEKIGQTSAQNEADNGYTPTVSFTVYDAAIKEVRLSDFAGKPVVVNFWATWCPWCVAEFPHYQKAFETYGDRVAFLMIDLTDGYRETTDGAKRYLEENGYTFPGYYDLRGEAANAFAVSSIPVSVFIDANGRVVNQFIGALTEEALNDNIKQILQ